MDLDLEKRGIENGKAGGRGVTGVCLSNWSVLSQHDTFSPPPSQHHHHHHQSITSNSTNNTATIMTTSNVTSVQHQRQSWQYQKSSSVVQWPAKQASWWYNPGLISFLPTLSNKSFLTLSAVLTLNRTREEKSVTMIVSICHRRNKQKHFLKQLQCKKTQLCWS